MTEDHNLSAKEHEVLFYLVRGLSNKSIGNNLLISEETVKVHVRNIMKKMNVSNRTQAALKAIGYNPENNDNLTISQYDKEIGAKNMGEFFGFNK